MGGEAPSQLLSDVGLGRERPRTPTNKKDGGKRNMKPDEKGELAVRER